MPATAGLAPWNKYWEPVKSTKKGNISTYAGGDYEWGLSEGWHYRRPNGWKTNGGKSGTVKKTRLTLPDGDSVIVYKTQGYDDYVGFQAGYNLGSNEELSNFVAEAFANENDYKENRDPGKGHIVYLIYNPRLQVLKTIFRNGDKCIFFRVPWSVAGHLLYLINNNATRSDGKHLVGIEFWDLIRIRGQRTGARYPFEYQDKKNSVYGYNKYTVSDERKKEIIAEAAVDKSLLKAANKKEKATNGKNSFVINELLAQEERAESLNPETAFINNEESGHDKIQQFLIDYPNKTVNDVYSAALRDPDSVKRLLEYDSEVFNATKEGRKNVNMPGVDEYRQELLDALALEMPSEVKKEVINNYLGNYSKGSKIDEGKLTTSGAEENLRKQRLLDYMSGDRQKHDIAEQLLIEEWSGGKGSKVDWIDKEIDKTYYKAYGKTYNASDVEERVNGIFAESAIAYIQDVSNGNVSASDEVSAWAEMVNGLINKSSNFKARKTEPTSSGLSTHYIDKASIKKILGPERFNDYQSLMARVNKYVNRGNAFANELNLTSTSGKIWTPEDLRNFSNYMLPDSGDKNKSNSISRKHADIYKRFINNGDYEAALDFLKTHRGDNKKVNYASSNDKFKR